MTMRKRNFRTSWPRSWQRTRFSRLSHFPHSQCMWIFIQTAVPSFTSNEVFAITSSQRCISETVREVIISWDAYSKIGSTFTSNEVCFQNVFQLIAFNLTFTQTTFHFVHLNVISEISIWLGICSNVSSHLSI